VWLTDFAEHGYKFIIRGFISSDKVTERFEIESQIRFELVRRLRQDGIHIAVPIRFIRQINGHDDAPIMQK
jgi:small-conductance mechanosensitive channel